MATRSPGLTLRTPLPTLGSANNFSVKLWYERNLLSHLYVLRQMIRGQGPCHEVRREVLTAYRAHHGGLHYKVANTTFHEIVYL